MDENTFQAMAVVSGFGYTAGTVYNVECKTEVKEARHGGEVEIVTYQFENEDGEAVGVCPVVLSEDFLYH